MSHTHLRHGRRLKGNGVAFWLIFGLSFALVLTIALIGSLIHLPWRKWLPGAESCKSLIGGVQSAVYSFMSYL